MRLATLITSIAIVLVMISQSAVRADCNRKSQMISSAILRIHDYANSTDTDQQTRDADAIRSLNFSIDDEDCVGISKANQQLVDLITLASVDLMASGDFSPTAMSGPIDFQPTQIQVGKSIESDAPSACRCYARKVALDGIEGKAAELRSDWTSRDSSEATDAIESLWTILDLQVQETTGIGLGRITDADSKWWSNWRLIWSQFAKHCGYDETTKPTTPGGCDFSIEGAQTPEPSPT